MKESHRNILTASTMALGTTAAIVHAAGLTTVVASAAPIASATKTALVVTKSGAMYLNVVKAPLVYKCISATIGISISAFLAYCVYESCTITIKE